MSADYPRPQLVRKGMTSLDGAWDFAIDTDGQGLLERWWEDPSRFTETIQVPFPPESRASGIGCDVDAPLWYRREFTHEPREGYRVLLHFEGVDHRCAVWVNGVRVGEHTGSQSRFTFDVTDLSLRGTNLLVVRTVDPTGDLEIPRGKQDWQSEPHVIWYRRTSGIWRTVWLEQVPELRVDRLVLHPREDLASLDLECRLVGPFTGSTVEVEVSLGDRLLAQVAYGCTSARVRGVIVLDHEALDTEPENLWWSPEQPTLLDVRMRVRRNGVVVDDVESYVGLRTVGADESHVLLNGRPYFLRLVLEQGYWPDTHLSSPSFEALEREVNLVKELGFNGIRMHQTSADPRFLALCDRLGLVVWADAAAAYQYSDVALSRTTAELIELVARDANHPCVIAWVPFNESWGVPRVHTSAAEQHAVTAMYALLKALDPTRLVLGNDGWQYVVGDLIGLHDYEQDPHRLRGRYGTPEQVRQTVAAGYTGGRRMVLAPEAPRVPVLLTEFGGISVHDDDTAWKGYGEVVDAGNLAGRLGALVGAVGDSSGLAGYCYTQLTDTLQEKNGLVDERRVPKWDPAVLRAVFQQSDLGPGTS